MILFARSQGHARRQVQGIIGVPACVPIPAKDDDQKLEGERASCIHVPTLRENQRTTRISLTDSTLSIAAASE
jgi:hypothetical protein